MAAEGATAAGWLVAASWAAAAAGGATATGATLMRASGHVAGFSIDEAIPKVVADVDHADGGHGAPSQTYAADAAGLPAERKTKCVGSDGKGILRRAVVQPLWRGRVEPQGLSLMMGGCCLQMLASKATSFRDFANDLADEDGGPMALIML